MSNTDTSVVLFYSDENGGIDSVVKTLHSLAIQKSDLEIFIIDISNENVSVNTFKEAFNSNESLNQIHIIKCDKDETFGTQLNKAFESVTKTHVLFLDNRSNQIIMKNGSVDLFKLATQRSKNCGLVYADYELAQSDSVKEVKLLKHHIGRVRDNQDFGKVFFLSKAALNNVSYANGKLKFNTLYDLRLRLSEKYELLHLANRYSGSLYSIIAEDKSQNVFDYLLASKESQLEAEEVLGNHLKNISANLEAGNFYMPRPSAPQNATLKASVIIPTNNRPDFIATAIESVQAQTIKEVEVIVVVNGGDDDPTVQSVRKYLPGGEKYDPDKPGVQLLEYDINNLGLCLNMGAQYAKGEYYVQLDSDDRLKPDAVEKILAVYKEDPNIGMVIGSYEVWEKQENGEITRMEDLPVVTHDEWTESNGRNNLLRINGAGAPRSIPIELIRQVGFSVNEEPYCRNYGEDYGMVLKLSEKHRIGRVWDAIYEVIRHSGGTDHSIDQETIDRNDEAKDYMRQEAISRRIKLNNEK
ncbi:MAG: glycosyltransferase [Calditrichaeota bacterium]|nr:MAG: glycosyltransferase [Calditrichota bacterium]MBL1204354.1 glycosyltransferase [Calditrichota bacterium]NOG44183.1 glycosyltransferase family 2 protein [Calditrichota bacterium]